MKTHLDQGDQPPLDGRVRVRPPVPGRRLELDDLFDRADLDAEIDTGRVTCKRHPELPLRILTYSPSCQFDNHWNPVTVTCRGLIADDAGRIVALPFPKIFASGMHGGGHAFAPPLPVGERFEVYDKTDGSLIIVFHYAHRWHAATKGSFNSVQARWAQARLDASDTGRLDPDLTYLAEAVYPANRIVVDYGTREDLVLLATYRPAAGTEVALADAARDWEGIGSVVRSWDVSGTVAHLEWLAARNATPDGAPASGVAVEGVVVRFASGLRAKIKLDEYMRYHAVLTGTNERTIWAALVAGNDVGDLFDRVPDEFRDWARRVAGRLTQRVHEWVAAARADFEDIGRSPDRREFALRAAESEYRAALFMLYDGRDIEPLAWKHVRPRADTPYTSEPEE